MFGYEGRSGIFRRSLRLVTDREDGAIGNKETTTIEDQSYLSAIHSRSTGWFDRQIVPSLYLTLS
jgi:hypothetical protein